MLNIVPKTGGNRFKGTIFGSGAGRMGAGQQRRRRAAKRRASPRRRQIKLWDVSVAMGGPIKRDKMWFFANYRD